MKILALETTERFGSVALLSIRGLHCATSPALLAEITLPKDQRSSQTLHPALQSLFETTQTVPQEINIVVVVVGPGSFTGLRVGVTAAKVFAYTTGAKVIALNTFQTVAAAAPTRADVISVGVDAQRGEVVTAILRRSKEGNIETMHAPKLIAVADWWKHAEQFDHVLFAGPALERWHSKAPPHIVMANEADWFPQASVAGKLATSRIASEHFDDVWSLLPVYSRLSAAEEKIAIPTTLR
jgi:tRNA threonylcarbamoyladenosine biosynthesis protein TsaB